MHAYIKEIKGDVFQEAIPILNIISFYHDYDIPSIAGRVQLTSDGSKPVDDMLKKRQKYVVFGKLKQGLSANKDNFDYAAAVAIDIEYQTIKGKQTESLEMDEIIQVVNKVLDGYSFVIHNTVNSQEHFARMRIIIPTDKTMNQAEYEATWDVITEKLNELPIDGSSREWYRLQGLPIYNGLSTDYIDVVEGDNSLEVQPTKRRRSRRNKSKKNIQKIEHEDFIAAMGLIVDKDYDNLEKEQHYFKWFNILENGVANSEITEEMAFEAIKYISLGNPEWTKKNYNRLRNELRKIDNGTLKDSEYTVRDKLNSISDMATDPENPVKRAETAYHHVGMAALSKRLEEMGAEWRSNNTDDKGKCPVMPHYTIANYLKNNVSFLLIGETKDMSKLFYYDYDQGIYRSSETDIHKMITLLEFRSKLNIWKDVIGYLRVNAKQSKLFSDPDFIPCNNGLYQESTGKLLPFSYKYPIITKLETDFNPNAKLVNHKLRNGGTWNVDNWISELVEGDSELIELLYQMFNETFNSNRNRKGLGFFIGKSNSGKGTLAKLITNIVGADKVSSLKVEDFKDKFRVANLEGKVANIGDDISTSYIDNVQDLMSLASGDPITIEMKFGHAYRAEFKMFCLFSGEAMPRVSSKEDGWINRLKIIPFNKGYSTNDAIPEIKDELIDKKDVKEYVLKKALETKFDRFIQPQATNKLLSEYRKENDYIYAYITDEYIPNGFHELERVPRDFIKNGIQQMIWESNSKQGVKYHYMKDVLKYLEQETEYKYDSDSVKYPMYLLNVLPDEMKRFVKKGNSTTRSVIKKVT